MERDHHRDELGVGYFHDAACDRVFLDEPFEASGAGLLLPGGFDYCPLLFSASGPSLAVYAEDYVVLDCDYVVFPSLASLEAEVVFHAVVVAFEYASHYAFEVLPAVLADRFFELFAAENLPLDLL